MKIRYSFVSNSSSSSFVFVGWELEITDEFLEKVCKSNNIEFNKEEFEDYPSGYNLGGGLSIVMDQDGEPHALGYELFATYNNSLDSVSLNKLQETIEKAQEFTKKFSELGEPKLMAQGEA